MDDSFVPSAKYRRQRSTSVTSLALAEVELGDNQQVSQAEEETEEAATSVRTT